MMTPFAFVLAVALAPPGGPAASSPAPTSSTRELLEQKITLGLKDADLGQVLDRLATLLGKTLILEPGIAGTVTMDVQATPVSSILAGFEASHGLVIRLEGDRMFVTRAGAASGIGAKPDDERLDRELLSDASLPRRPAAATPRRFDGAFVLRATNGARATWDLGDVAGTLSVPGCPSPVTVLRLPGDLFDGVPRAAFAEAGARLARIVAPGGSLRLPGCSAPFTFETLDAYPSVSAATPLPRGPILRIRVAVLEAGAAGDEVLAAPSLLLPAGEVGTIQSGSAKSPSSSAQTIRMSLGVLEAGPDDALVACSLSLTRDIEPAPGAAPVTVRVARADESLRLAYGKTERLNLSPTFGRGGSALVLSLTLDRPPQPPAR